MYTILFRLGDSSKTDQGAVSIFAYLTGASASNFSIHIHMFLQMLPLHESMPHYTVCPKSALNFVS